MAVNKRPARNDTVTWICPYDTRITNARSANTICIRVIYFEARLSFLITAPVYKYTSGSAYETSLSYKTLKRFVIDFLFYPFEDSVVYDDSVKISGFYVKYDKMEKLC